MRCFHVLLGRMLVFGLRTYKKINPYAKKQTFTKNNKPFLKKPALDPLPVCRTPLSPEYHLQPTRSENTLAYNIPVSNRDYHLHFPENC